MDFDSAVQIIVRGTVSLRQFRKMWNTVPHYINCLLCSVQRLIGYRGNTVVKVLCYKSEGRWFDPIWCQWIFY